MPHHHKPKPKPHNKDVPFAARLVDANMNTSLVVDGSAAPIEYLFVPPDDVVVTELALIFEGHGAIEFGDNFVTLKALVNGIDIELQSYGMPIVFTFKTTRNLLEIASPDGFFVGDGGGRAIVKATRRFTEGLVLRDKRSDFIKLTVEDDLTGLTYGVASVLGYTD